MSVKTQPPKSRLGRGLSSLISLSSLPVEVEVAVPGASLGGTQQPSPPAGAVDTPASGNLPRADATVPAEIPVDQIAPNPHQPRKTMPDNSLGELAASIKSTGIIQPVVVKKVDGGYQLIAGERRLRAAKLAGLSAVPAIVRDVDAVAQAQMALIENIQREDLNPIERAAAYRALIDDLGLTQADLAGRLGEDRSSIANYLRLLELAEPVRAMLRDGRLSFGHAKLIAGVPDILEQERLANLVQTQALSVRGLERALQQPNPPAPTPAPAGHHAHIQDLEKSLTRQLGMRVQIRTASKKGRGRLVVHYTNLDQFDDLLNRLGLAAE